MKFLIITQDLRISGTSQGIIERSFLFKLRRTYPESIIDVVYMAPWVGDDDLHLLPVNSMQKHVVASGIPFHVKWINRISSRFFNVLYAENYLHQHYVDYLKKIDFSGYDHIFIRSSGLNHEVILATHNLPILKPAIVNFHDPYPLSWYLNNASRVSKSELIRLKKVMEVAQQAKDCCSSAYYMSKDLQYLYASNKYFYTLPHQFELAAFDLSKKEAMRKKEAKIQISYHGALMFGRNVFNLLDAYVQLIEENTFFKENTEFVLRVKGEGIARLKEKFSVVENIKILDCLDFSNSSNEQIYESDINVILENGPYYCNILVGKAAFLASIGKPVFIVSPERSELRRIVKEERYIANMNDTQDIKSKLKVLIDESLINNTPLYPFGDYFSDENFKNQLDAILDRKEFI